MSDPVLLQTGDAVLLQTGDEELLQTDAGIAASTGAAARRWRVLHRGEQLQARDARTQ